MPNRSEIRPAPDGQPAWLPCAILLLALFLAYLPVWYAGFIWDDDVVITGNPVIVGPLGLKEIWTTRAADICPLVLTSFWAEHAVWGLDPLPFHLLNLALHAACGVLLWRVLLALRVPGAWFGAALWALHPVQVETAAWITEMKNTQSGVFYLLAILFFIRGLEIKPEAGGKSPVGVYAAMFVCAVAAMASKSSTIVLPIVLGLCGWWVEGRWRWRNLAVLAPLALLATIPVAVTLWTQKMTGQGPENAQWVRSFPERLATAGDAIWFYLGKLVWPHPLIFVYPRWRIDAGSWVSYLPLVAVVVVVAWLWLKRDTAARPWFFAFAYFIAALLPVIGLVDGYFWRYSLVGDHFQYLASMGPLALVGAGLTRLVDLVVGENFRLRARMAAGILLVLGVLSWQRAWAYQDLETLWSDTVTSDPKSWMAFNNLGNVYLDKNELDLARANYEKALAINPQEVNALSNLGIIYARENRLDEAIAEFQAALAIRPGFSRPMNNLAAALYAQGHVDAALDEYLKTEAVNPYFPQIHYNLGRLFREKGQLDAARGEYERALQIEPDNAPAMNELGLVLLAQGHRDEAIAQFQQALRLMPGDAGVLKNLADAQALQKAGGK
jgi:tetratricopeptide (TPR) repeat protein